MHGRGRTHRAKGIVRHQVHIVRLAPAGDFHRLGQPADIADIESVELVDAALDVRQEIPLAGKFLADGKRRGRFGRVMCGDIALSLLVC